MLFSEFDIPVGTRWFVAGRHGLGLKGQDVLFMLSLLLLLLERWIKDRNAWTKVSWIFLGTGGDRICLPVPTPIIVTRTGVNRPLA